MTLTTVRDLDGLRGGLERWLGRPAGEIRRASAGYSCETLIVDDELVVRLPPAGEGTFPTYDLEQQAAVQDTVGAAGVPTASPSRFEPDPSFLGAPFVTLPYVGGSIPGELTSADPWLLGLPDDAARRGVWEAFLVTLAAIHRTPSAGLGLRAGLAAELDHWDEYLAWASDGSPPPALAEVLTWCRANRPAAEPPGGLLWGDARLGNVVFDPVAARPRAVLDWDMASVGPIEMDLAWFLALEGVLTDLTATMVPGFGDSAQAVAVVEQQQGRPLVDLAWYEVFALARASAISTRIAILHQRAGQRSLFKVGEDPTLMAARARIDAW